MKASRKLGGKASTKIQIAFLVDLPHFQSKNKVVCVWGGLIYDDGFHKGNM